MSVRVEPHPEIEHPPHTAAGRGEKKKNVDIKCLKYLCEFSHCFPGRREPGNNRCQGLTLE